MRIDPESIRRVSRKYSTNTLLVGYQAPCKVLCGGVLSDDTSYEEVEVTSDNISYLREARPDITGHL